MIIYRKTSYFRLSDTEITKEMRFYKGSECCHGGGNNFVRNGKKYMVLKIRQGMLQKFLRLGIAFYLKTFKRGELWRKK